MRRAAFVGCSIAAAACGGEQQFFHYPPLQNAKSALIAVMTPDSIDIFGYEPEHALAFRTDYPIDAPSIEAMTLTSKLEDQGLTAGTIAASGNAPRSVAELPSLLFLHATPMPTTGAWEEASALDPRFLAFGVPAARDPCLPLEEVARSMVPDGRPTFAFPLDDGSMFVGSFPVSHRVTREGSFPIAVPAGAPWNGAIRENEQYWVGGEDGVLWSGVLDGDRFDIAFVASASTAGTVRWMSKKGSTILALTEQGAIVRFEGSTAEILARIPPKTTGTQNFAKWGGIAWISDHEALIVNGSSTSALLYDAVAGTFTEEPLPLMGTIVGPPDFGGTALIHDEANHRTLVGSSGQILVRNDATTIWTSLGLYDFAEPWNASHFLLNGSTGFFIGDASGRVRQFSTEKGGGYCFPVKPGIDDIVALFPQGDELVVISGLSFENAPFTRVNWLRL